MKYASSVHPLCLSLFFYPLHIVYTEPTLFVVLICPHFDVLLGRVVVTLNRDPLHLAKYYPSPGVVTGALIPENGPLSGGTNLLGLSCVGAVSWLDSRVG